MMVKTYSEPLPDFYLKLKFKIQNSYMMSPSGRTRSFIAQATDVRLRNTAITRRNIFLLKKDLV